MTEACFELAPWSQRNARKARRREEPQKPVLLLTDKDPSLILRRGENHSDKQEANDVFHVLSNPEKTGPQHKEQSAKHFQPRK
jgi:hypothetical protein